MALRLKTPSADRPALAALLLDSTPFPVIGVNAEDRIVFANAAAQDLFLLSTSMLEKAALSDVIAASSPLFDVITRARREGAPVSEREIMLEGPSHAYGGVDVTAAPSDDPGLSIVLLRPRGRARAISDRWAQSGAARSVAGLGQMLAHEIKNPLAGIRGAAQLLMRSVNEDADRALGQLIVDETDRVRRLIDRMEEIGDVASPVRRRVNIHAVLDRVAALASSAMGDRVRLARRFDPSLPELAGDEDRLIQAYLNLVKNAAEAVRQRGDKQGEIVLSTAFRPGVRIRSSAGAWVTLPLEVAVSDNGPGVAESVRPHLFEPFVTTKQAGSGLGLPLVAKIIAEHGGVVEFESQPGRTVFRTLMPVETA